MSTGETHLQDLKFRLMTVDLLKTAKKRYTYRELMQKTDLPVTVLSRYVKGHVLPSGKRARGIWDALEKLIGLEEELRNRVSFDDTGYFDNTAMIGDTGILQQAALYALTRFAGKRVTKVLTAAVDGVPLATSVATSLGVDLVIAKKGKEVGVKEFVEEMYIPDDSGFMVSLYIPKGSMKRGDSVLIVDDVIRSGDTQVAMMNLVTRAKAEIVGIYALVGIGDEWRKKLPPYPNVTTEVVLNLKPK
jgi:adenine phosphoribosyltransferase